MKKSVAIMLWVLPFLGAPWVARAQQVADTAVVADPTQEATLELQQHKEREEGTGASVHGVGYLQYFMPYGEANSVNLFLGILETQWTNGTFGVYSAARVKVTDAGRPDSKGYLFFQQAYGFWRHDFGDIKVGKVYSRFGRLWDYGFYGPLQAVNDLKLQPELGISAEGLATLAGPVDIEYAAQYFAADGKTFALANDDFFSAKGMRRRNLVVGRVAPIYRFDSQTSVGFGLSGQRFESVHTDGHQVLRGAVDVDAKYGPFGAFAEAGRQAGGDRVTSQNKLIASHNYVWTGASIKLLPATLRYHFNATHYEDGARTVEYLHQPGLEMALNDYATLMAEAALWTSSDPTKGTREKSLYLIAAGKF